MDFWKLPFMQCVTQLLVNENILQSFHSESQITFIVTSPQHMCLGEWDSWERSPDSAEIIYI